MKTMILHRSGQYLVFDAAFPIAPQKDKKTGELQVTAQSAASASTYLRRYALAAIAGVAQVDDDGNEASKPVGRQKQADDTMFLVEDIKAAMSLERLKELEPQVRELGLQEVADVFTKRRAEIRAAKESK